MHRPPPDVSLEALEKGTHPAQQRLIFEELLAHNLAMQKVRIGTQQFFAYPLSYQTDLKQRFWHNYLLHQQMHKFVLPKR